MASGGQGWQTGTARAAATGATRGAKLVSLTVRKRHAQSEPFQGNLRAKLQTEQQEKLLHQNRPDPVISNPLKMPL